MNKPLFALTLALGIASTVSVQAQQATTAPAINDAQIAHIAYTAGVIDITAAKQALKNPATRTYVRSPRKWRATMRRSTCRLWRWSRSSV